MEALFCFQKKETHLNNDIPMNVEHAAKLAQLALSPDEKNRLGEELPRIMAGLRAQLQTVDAAAAEPMIYGGNAAGGWRPDVPGPMLDRAEALQQAPEKLGDEFKMPRIVE
jgi:aspartyl/glutamyl-tRNA(Asn/Gln) amidotransferase C subunit